MTLFLIITCAFLLLICGEEHFRLNEFERDLEWRMRALDWRLTDLEKHADGDKAD